MLDLLGNIKFAESGLRKIVLSRFTYVQQKFNPLCYGRLTSHATNLQSLEISYMSRFNKYGKYGLVDFACSLIGKTNCLTRLDMQSNEFTA